MIQRLRKSKIDLQVLQAVATFVVRFINGKVNSVKLHEKNHSKISHQYQGYDTNTYQCISF